ncbi:hypothetical protein DUNSADRAFT_4939 [Dunaliella salina]|uniref:Uncharacterized protein n=1 Tax=Dunaliella salina TaxID=3046 RepID=A0ABQ7FUI9_DUNSA|nr:hypothetical protein DUNSADRAFT_4939 [Dunaliella salina]|eukprot:KAF5826078.1 hypothetical protein DUNSADRAFT_4939 [Dunaliella salina]
MCMAGRLDHQRATRLAQQLHAHSVQYAHKLATTRRAIEHNNTSHSQSTETAIITFNRLSALQRLVKSLMQANYLGDSVSLTINIEAGSPKEVVDYVQTLKWPFGSLRRRHRASPSGLVPAVVESWFPSSCQEYGLLLEDDIEVSPFFYVWLKQAIVELRASDKFNRTFGISLYTPRVTETTNPYQRFYPDIQLRTRSNAYFYQVPCSWGALQFPKHWVSFTEYMRHRLSYNSSFMNVPMSRTNGWTNSWKKFYIEFAWSHGLFMLYPNFPNQTSFSTNHLEQGVHISDKGLKHLPSDYTVPLHMKVVSVLSSTWLPSLQGELENFQL